MLRLWSPKATGPNEAALIQYQSLEVRVLVNDEHCDLYLDFAVRVYFDTMHRRYVHRYGAPMFAYWVLAEARSRSA